MVCRATLDRGNGYGFASLYFVPIATWATGLMDFHADINRALGGNQTDKYNFPIPLLYKTPGKRKRETPP